MHHTRWLGRAEPTAHRTGVHDQVVVAKNAIKAAMKIPGTLAYSTESPLQQRYRDATAYLVADGTAETIMTDKGPSHAGAGGQQPRRGPRRK